MKRSRWVFLVLCGLLSVVLVVPVGSATNLVVNGDFLASGGAPDVFAISYSQCVATSGLTSVDVGGWVRFLALDSGNIVGALYSASGCNQDDASGGTVLVLTDEDTQVGLWTELWQSYALPQGQEYTSAKITLNTDIRANEGGAYFDDIFLRESDPTSVLVVQPSGRAPTGLIAAAVLVGIGAVAALKRLNV